MKEKVLVLDTGYDSFEYEENLFNQNGFKFEIFPGMNSDIAGKIKFAHNAVGLLIRWTVIDEDFLKQTPHLKAIVRYGAGYENVDLEAASRRGVNVSNVRGYGNHAVSDHALALMYACARHLPEGMQQVKSKFGAPPDDRIFEFHTKTLGIIGLGRIGETLAGKAVHLFEKVFAVDPYIPNEQFANLDVQKKSLDQLLEESDVISIHCNLTPETEGIIDDWAFKKMAKTPILINTARGPIIDEQALLNALEEKYIFKAGIDVYRTELPEELPERLIHHPKVIATGHYAWYSERSHVELQKRAADNLLAMLQGRIPEDCLNG